MQAGVVDVTSGLVTDQFMPALVKAKPTSSGYNWEIEAEVTKGIEAYVPWGSKADKVRGIEVDTASNTSDTSSESDDGRSIRGATCHNPGAAATPEARAFLYRWRAHKQPKR